MEELRASEGQGESGVWKDVSRFCMEDGSEGTEPGSFESREAAEVGEGRLHQGATMGREGKGRYGWDRQPGGPVKLPWDWLAAEGMREKSKTRPSGSEIGGWWASLRRTYRGDADLARC